MTAPLNKPDAPPLKLAGTVLLLILALIFTFVVLQFRGKLTPETKLTMVATRSGLVMDPNSKVTYNGVEIGRVKSIEPTMRDGKEAARLDLEVSPKFIKLIPSNVVGNIEATTIFGNKYVSLSSPSNPSPARISSTDVIDARSVTTEFNTLFETITGIAEKIDPVELNLTLSATAEALTGLGTKLGESLVNANVAMDNLNPRLPRLQYGLQRLAGFADIYTAAGPDLWDGLDNALTTVQTLNNQRGDLDAVLLASAGFGNTGADVFERGAPYLIRSLSDLVSTSQLLNTYSPELHCMLRNYAEALPMANSTFGGNGYSLNAISIAPLGAPNPYIYPDNLPRVNARGGPGGAPGCWQKVTRDFWPAPALVADTGASIAPYNHFEIGQPLLTEYVWGRQFGENTINP
ncbi:MAG: MCE family protein [Actinomycetota bacterium]|nr:MCE family protein [Actinomycetota bacterium]MDA2949411.1 MCE family protein [Actinomycetota bacterium]MDA2990781.1 MCE family protein [Actinomycetota bacterium]